MTPSVCRADIPYPSVSQESVPSLIDNLVSSLYGTALTKAVVGGKVVWTIPCDPNAVQIIYSLPKITGEGLLCFILRALATGSVPNITGSSVNSLLYQSAVNTTRFLPTGTLGQVLTSQGSASPPTWTSLLNPVVAALIFG